MTLPRTLRRTLGLLAAAFISLSAAAQTDAPPALPTVTLGDQTLSIPAPAGLADAMPDAPLLVEVLRRSMTGGKRLLVLFTRPQEIAESQVRRKAVRMPISSVVFTLSGADTQTVTPQQFLAMQAEMERGFSAAMAAALKERQARHAASGASATRFETGGTDIAPELLGVLSKSDTHLTMANQGSVTRNAGATNTTVYTVTTVVLVRGRMLNMVTTYLAPADNTARRAGDAARAWAAAVVAANAN